jgi:DNA-directed RNA polymerase sigma subunit (sigma70/sigma32)
MLSSVTANHQSRITALRQLSRVTPSPQGASKSLGTLTEREREVLEQRFGRHGRRSG